MRAFIQATSISSKYTIKTEKKPIGSRKNQKTGRIFDRFGAGKSLFSGALRLRPSPFNPGR
jgi:hypothetical protein